MECKVYMYHDQSSHPCVLIETSWNVKTYNSTMNRSRSSVLIETSWNVKFSTESFLDCVVSVLIETSWNVKACSPSNNLTAISINRNIVECKERSWICCMKRDRGINRNIVECKGTVG